VFRRRLQGDPVRPHHHRHDPLHVRHLHVRLLPERHDGLLLPRVLRSRLWHQPGRFGACPARRRPHSAGGAGRVHLLVRRAARRPGLQGGGTVRRVHVLAREAGGPPEDVPSDVHKRVRDTPNPLTTRTTLTLARTQFPLRNRSQHVPDRLRPGQRRPPSRLLPLRRRRWRARLVPG
jgi:hypothetical protein